MQANYFGPSAGRFREVYADHWSLKTISDVWLIIYMYLWCQVQWQKWVEPRSFCMILYLPLTVLLFSITIFVVICSVGKW
jgi:hypothetical protein